MTELVFDDSGSAHFQSGFDGEVRLSKATWENHILGRPERGHLKFNAQKIPTTLIHPDHVRESLSDGPEVHLYYKEFPRWRADETIELPTPKFMKYVVVVVDTKKRLIMTAYETGKIKQGKPVAGG